MKKFLKKHISLVVIIVAIIVAGTNYLVYPLFIKKDMQLVEVPVAIAKINEQTRITPELITKVEVVENYLPSSVIKDENQIIGKYVANDSAIATGGFFYNDLLSDEQYVMGNVMYKLYDNEYAYSIQVDSKDVLNSDIKVGHLINIYVSFSYQDENNISHFVFGQIAENKRVVAINEDRTNITLALNEDEIAYFNLAERGLSNSKLIPALYFDSLGIKGTYTEYYDIIGMKNYMLEKATILDRSVVLYDDLSEEGENVNQEEE